MIAAAVVRRSFTTWGDDLENRIRFWHFLIQRAIAG